MTGFRIPEGGHVDRTRPISFRFNGRTLSGFSGDTLASALLANGVGTLARSLKYHRPRGIYAAGVEDPNAMLAVRDGHGYDPAIRAGQVLLAEGLDARSVTGWPSAKFDLPAPAIQILSRFMTAGFYYKTLKWPNWSWYEETVRSATGFGHPDGTTETRTRGHRHDVCDVLIIGAGPAGIVAATALAKAGRNVILADQGLRPGGTLRWEAAQVSGRPGYLWAEEAIARFVGAGGRYLPSTFVTGAYEGNSFTLLQSITDAQGVAGECLWKLRAGACVLATGAVDRPLVFQNNDRSGVMLSAGVRRFLTEYGAAAGKQLAIAVSDDSGYLTALAAADAGLAPPLLLDAREKPGEALVEAARAKGVTVMTDVQIADTEGRSALRAIRTIEANGKIRRHACDALAVVGGVTPLVHLAAHRGAKPRYDKVVAGFLCPELPEGWHGAGAVTGVRGLAEALAQGARAAEAITGIAGDIPKVEVQLSVSSGEPVWQARSGKPSKMFVDLQNDVKASDVALAARENYRSVEHLKRYTTLGMGTDQGRTSNVNGLAILAAETGQSLDQVGTTTFRPPYTATRMGAIAHHRQRDGYAPHRLMPAHELHASLGAQFEDFGWERPDWYASNGTDRETAVAVEMGAVRDAVGIFDASPLGKIEVAGPDARKFLNSFYVSNIAGLKPGRIRYSVMLHDDGVIFDDGVLTCIDDNFFLAGPTSGNAEVVASWLEQWRQTEWPDMRVAITPVTSQWVAVALSGPRSRDLLARLEPDMDISAEALAHMQFCEGRLAGVPARIARVSFTGELQYEISVPARYGADLMRRALKQGAALGAKPIGMEAWLRLRLEKGYLHLGSDTNGRTTPDDIGMGGVAAKKPVDFIGKRALSLHFNRAEDREQLVGLKPVKGRIDIGARILAPGETRPPCRTIGYVTSAAETPGAGNIALALIEGGAGRMGEIVRLYAEGQIAYAEICTPVFYDAANERLRA